MTSSRRDLKPGRLAASGCFVEDLVRGGVTLDLLEVFLERLTCELGSPGVLIAKVELLPRVGKPDVNDVLSRGRRVRVRARGEAERCRGTGRDHGRDRANERTTIFERRHDRSMWECARFLSSPGASFLGGS